MERRTHYMYGNAAPKLPQRPERPERQERAERKVTREALPGRSASAYSRVPKGKLVFGIAILCAMCFVVLYRFSVLADLNSQMGKLTDKLSSLKDENRLLRVDIETSINLDRVKLIAEEQLGMHKPDRFQVVPVNVPKNDYSVVLNQQYIENVSGEGKSFFENALDAISAALP